MASALRMMLLAGLATGLSACLVPTYECSGVANPPGTGDGVDQTATAPVAKPIWPTLGGDRSRSAQSGLVGPQSADHASFFAAGSGFVRSVLVGADGTLYVSGDGVLYVMDESTGAVKWTFEGTGYFSPGLGPDGTVYVGTARNEVLALNPANGDVYWTESFSQLRSPINVAADRTVFFLTSEPEALHALDGRTGKEKWTYSTSIAEAAPAIGQDGTVYLQDVSKVYALDGQTGTLKWSTSACDGAFTNRYGPTVANGTVYVGGYQVHQYEDMGRDSKVHAFDAQTGAPKWQAPVDSAVWVTPAVGADGTVYVGTWYGGLYALDGQTGARKWTAEATTLSFDDVSFAVDAEGTLYFVDGWGRVSALDGQTGQAKWTMKAQSNLGAGPAIGKGGTLYVGALGGLYSIAR
ncbi:MAG: PQQ-binding-like beta-propeller repeat protein [Myxococcales bacterium]